MKSMEIIHELLGSVGILRETLNIFRSDRKLMASITALTLVIYSFFYISNIFSVKPLVADLIVKATTLVQVNPKSPVFADLFFGTKEDLLFIAGLNLIFFLIYLTLKFVSLTATIYVSSVTYHNNNFVSLKELLSSIVKSWLRPCVTWFYISLFSAGYCFHVLAISLSLYVLLSPIVAYFLFFLAIVFYTYLSVTWTLSLVISVLEENCYGIEALGKAGKLVKGMKIQGFSLNLLLTLLSFGVLQGLRLTRTQIEPDRIFTGWIVIILMCLVDIFGMIAYTIFYNICKKTHGEEVELQGNTEYSKIGTAPLVTDAYLP